MITLAILKYLAIVSDSLFITGKILNLLWQTNYVVGLICTFANGQISNKSSSHLVTLAESAILNWTKKLLQLFVE